MRMSRHVFVIGIVLVLCALHVTSSFPLEDLQSRIKGYVLSSHEKPNSLRQHLYNQSIYIDNGSYQIEPRAIVLPWTISDIQETIRFSQKYNTSFSVKGGGHSARGYCLNSDIVLDMRFFNNTYMMDEEKGLAYIEAGLQWMDVYPRLSPFIPVAGTCPHVGVMGFMLGGGYSMLSRSYGLGSDSVIEFRMVNSFGDYLIVNNQSYPDLYWALRGGGGGNFGVVVSVIAQTYRARNIFTAEICWSFEESLRVIDFYNTWTQSVPNEMAVYGLFFQVPHTNEDSFCLTFVYNGAYAKGFELFQPFLSFGGQVIFNKEQSFITFINGFSSGTTDIKNRLGLVKSGLVNKGGLNKQLVSTFYSYMTSRPSKSSMLIWSHVGGRVSEIDTESTAFYRRNAEFVLEIKAIFDSQDDYSVNKEWLDTFYAEMQPHFDGAYLNYIDSDLPDWKEAYYGSHYETLVNIKQKYDPSNFFKFKQSIGSKTKKKKITSKSTSKESEMVRIVHLFQTGQINRDLNFGSTFR